MRPNRISVAIGLAALMIASGTATAEEPRATPGPVLEPIDSRLVSDGQWLFDTVDPHVIPFRYRCQARSFAAADLVRGRPEWESSRLRPGGVGAAVLSETEDSVTIARVETPESERGPVVYTGYEREEQGWRMTRWGDCLPRASFVRLGGLGGFWRLDPTRPMPDPSSRRLHLRVWNSNACPSAFRLRGRPRVHLTDEAVLIAVPVRRRVNTDMCLPGKPERVTVRLTEPLGDRSIFDAGTLPLRRAEPILPGTAKATREATEWIQKGRDDRP